MDLTQTLPEGMANMLVIKNADAFVVKSMSLSRIVQNIVRCRTPMSIECLQGFVSDMIIRHLNAGNTASALQLLDPSHRGTEENVIAALVHKYTRALKLVAARMSELPCATGTLEAIEIEFREPDDDALSERLLQSRDRAEVTGIRSVLERRIEQIKARIQNTNMCCICHEGIVNKSVAPCCSNSYCLRCITQWLGTSTSSSSKKTCPMCKSPLSVSSMMVVVDSDEGGSARIDSKADSKTDSKTDLSAMNTKVKNLEILLRKRQPADKVIIFSLFDDTSLDTVCKILQKLGVSHARLKGNHAKVGAILKSYSRGDTSVLLVNPSNYGCGINMGDTTDIIMLHKLDNDIERQVIGRAHRYGRAEDLRVWYLLHENEIT